MGPWTIWSNDKFLQRPMQQAPDWGLKWLTRAQAPFSVQKRTRLQEFSKIVIPGQLTKGHWFHGKFIKNKKIE